MRKPFSQACENNKIPILGVLSTVFADRQRVLEVGSGSGQHAAWFARHLPHLQWQPSDLQPNLAGIDQWREEAELTNLQQSIEFDVNADYLPEGSFDGVFLANTLHIISWPEVENVFHLLQAHLAEDSKVCIYGPFNYGGQYTSDSNASFDDWLRARDPDSGIRDFEAVNSLAQAAGLTLVDDVAMPANNRLLYWRK